MAHETTDGRNLASRMIAGVAEAVRDIRTIHRHDRPTRRLVRAIFATFFVLTGVPLVWDLLLHGGADLPPLPRWFKMSADGSIPEIFAYTMAAGSAWLLFRIWRSSGVRACRALSLVFAFGALDDSLKYHENAGAWLAERLALPEAAGLSPDDLGELLAWALAGIALAVPLLLALLQRVRHTYGFVAIFLFCVGILLVFGIGSDMVQSATGSSLFAYLEEAGEMLGVALACACAFALRRGYAVPELAGRVRLPAIAAAAV
jgi:hypothetical protein